MRTSPLSSVMVPRGEMTKLFEYAAALLSGCPVFGRGRAARTARAKGVIAEDGTTPLYVTPVTGFVTAIGCVGSPFRKKLPARWAAVGNVEPVAALLKIRRKP